MKTQLTHLLAATLLFVATGAALAQDNASRLFGAFTFFMRRLRKAVGAVKERGFGIEGGDSTRKGLGQRDAFHPVAVWLMHNCWPRLIACALLTLSATQARGGFGPVWQFPTSGGNGVNPTGSLLFLENKLYGVTQQKDAGDYPPWTVNNNPWTVFDIDTSNPSQTPIALHTWYPQGGTDISGISMANGHLVSSGGWLYGTTQIGGKYGQGAVYAVNVDSGIPVLIYSFGGNGAVVNGNDGALPQAGLVLSVSGNGEVTLYGTTASGGSGFAYGTVFSINVQVDGSGYPVLSPETVLHSFNGTDGSQPETELASDGKWLYGTTSAGGANSHDVGTVFVVSVNGDTGGFNTLYTFDSTKDDFGNPQSLLLLGNTLYGTESGNGTQGQPGEAFGINLNTSTIPPSNANGNSYSMWLMFGNGGYQDFYGHGITQTGWQPVGGLIPVTLGEYPWLIGVTEKGGNGYGTVFTLQMEPQGQPLLTTYPLTQTQGTGPSAGFTQGGFYLFQGYQRYAVTGGGNGTVFEFSPVPELRIFPPIFRPGFPFNPGGVIMTWSDPPGFVFQSAPTVNGPWTNIDGATSPYTNDVNTSQQFFRLAVNLTNMPPLAPIVATLPVISVFTNAATLFGGVTPNGADSTAWFQYGPDTNYGSLTSTTFVSATNSLFVSNSISGLSEGMMYHYQLVASNSVGISVGADLTVTILPSVTTLPAGFIEPTNYIFNGLVSPNGFGWDCYAYFQYGTTTNYGQTTSQVFVSGTNTMAVGVSTNISGLLPGTLYHYEFWGTFIFALSYPPFSGYFNAVGGDLTFTTPPLAPTVATLPASSVTSSNAVLNGDITVNGADTTWAFQYGTTTNYGQFTASGLVSGTNTTAVAVSNLISGLLPGVLYHYQLLATNWVGAALGSDSTFTTLAAAPTATINVQYNGPPPYTFSEIIGTVIPNGADAYAWYNYGTTTNYGQSTGVAFVSASTTNPTNDVGFVINTTAGTTYHAQLVATNSVGAGVSPDFQFTTP